MKRTCNIRRGVPSDLENILALDRALITYDSTFDPSLDANWSETGEAKTFYLKRLSHREGLVLVADNNECLCGFLVGAEVEAATYRRRMRIAEVECLFIDEAYRGQKIASELLARFSDWSREIGADTVRVTVSARNQGARRFYEKQGFSDYDVVMEHTI